MLTIKVSVRLILKESSRPKIYQLQLEMLQIHEDVFILNVAVDDSGKVAGNDSLHNLKHDTWNIFTVHQKYLVFSCTASFMDNHSSATEVLFHSRAPDTTLWNQNGHHSHGHKTGRGVQIWTCVQFDIKIYWFYLCKEVPGKLLLKHALLSDEVEEVLAGVRPLHHDDEAVDPLEVVHEPHHPRASAEQVQQTDLQWNLVIPDLQTSSSLSSSSSTSSLSSFSWHLKLSSHCFDKPVWTILTNWRHWWIE